MIFLPSIGLFYDMLTLHRPTTYMISLLMIGLPYEMPTFDIFTLERPTLQYAYSL